MTPKDRILAALVRNPIAAIEDSDAPALEAVLALIESGDIEAVELAVRLAPGRKIQAPPGGVCAVLEAAERLGPTGVHPALAARLAGVHRNTATSALHTLSRQGYVKVTPFGGYAATGKALPLRVVKAPAVPDAVEGFESRRRGRPPLALDPEGILGIARDALRLMLLRPTTPLGVGQLSNTGHRRPLVLRACTAMAMGGAVSSNPCYRRGLAYLPLATDPTRLRWIGDGAIGQGP